MKKNIFYVLFLIIGSFCLIYILKNHEEDKMNNGFQRNIVDIKIKQQNVMRLTSQYMIIGKPSQTIFMNDPGDDSHLYMMNSNLKKIDTINLKIPNSFNRAFIIFKWQQNGYIYITNSFGHIAKIKNSNAISYKIDKLNMDFFRVLSENTLLVRTSTNTLLEKNRQLVKIEIGKSATIKRSFIIPKQQDGYFDNDGWLHYDIQNSRVYYMYFYRGEFLCLDTDLKLLYKTKTIDTVKKANIRVSLYTQQLKDGTKLTRITQQGPQKLINRYLTTNNGKIYVLSGLKADNESLSKFEGSQPIDVYSIKNGSYLYSFYLPRYKGLKLNSFEINGDNMVAIYGQYVVTFTMKDNLKISNRRR